MNYHAKQLIENELNEAPYVDPREPLIMHAAQAIFDLMKRSPELKKHGITLKFKSRFNPREPSPSIEWYLGSKKVHSTEFEYDVKKKVVLRMASIYDSIFKFGTKVTPRMKVGGLDVKKDTEIILANMKKFLPWVDEILSGPYGLKR